SGAHDIQTWVDGSRVTIRSAVSGTPSGASASVTPTSVSAGNSATLNVNAGSAAAGAYTLTVTGTEGSVTHATTVQLTVTAPSKSDRKSVGPSSVRSEERPIGSSTSATTVAGSGGRDKRAGTGSPVRA